MAAVADKIWYPIWDLGASVWITVANSVSGPATLPRDMVVSMLVLSMRERWPVTIG